MANYYYLGRSAFPDILIWLVVCLVLSSSGLLTMMYGISASSEELAIQERLSDDLMAVEHKINGASVESAMQAVAKYRPVMGKLDAKEDLAEAFKNNARLERRHSRKVLSMIDARKDDTEIQAWLNNQVYEGINRKLAREKSLIILYTGLVDGSDQITDLQNTLEKEEKIPVEIKSMATHTDFQIIEGARAKLNVYRGNNSNLWVQVEDLISQEGTSIERTTTKYKERIAELPKLRDEYLLLNKKMDEERAKYLSEQSVAWAAFLDETKHLVDRKRENDLEVYGMQTELAYLESLLVSQVKGQDFIPPLDLIDGTILSSDPNSNVVVIDVGRLNALRLGQKFDVFKVKGETLHDKKGRIEVVSLQPNVAVCRVIDSIRLDPIVPGDKIANGSEDRPFDRKIAPTYVLSGRFYKSYSKELVGFMIKRAGGVIKNQIYKEISYVVIGDQPNSDDIKRCQQLGVRTVRVRDLPNHLNFKQDDIAQLRKQHWN
jgi:hypothetical protein